MKPAFRLAPPVPADRGRLLTADQVAAELFSGHVRPQWVKRYLKVGRVRVSHRMIFWREYDVRDWLDTQTENRRRLRDIANLQRELFDLEAKERRNGR